MLFLSQLVKLAMLQVYELRTNTSLPTKSSEPSSPYRLKLLKALRKLGGTKKKLFAQNHLKYDLQPTKVNSNIALVGSKGSHCKLEVRVTSLFSISFIDEGKMRILTQKKLK